MSTEEQLSQIKGVKNLSDFYNSNKKNINIAFGVFVVVLGSIWYYFKYYQPGREIEAQGQLFMAERYFKLDSFDLALNGDGQYPGLISVAEDFGNTNAGNLAHFYAGRILMDKGQFQDAIDHLDKASFDDEIVAAAKYILIGDCYSELGEYEKAGSQYLKGAKKRSNEVTTPMAYKKAAIAFEASGNYNKAIEAWRSIMTEFYEIESANQAEKYIAKLEVMASR